jgi:tellurite resistance protein
MSDSGELASRAHALLSAGEITAEGLDSLMEIALRDGVVDEDERAVLREVIRKIGADAMDIAMQARIDALRDQFGV